ncbi:IPT/TIG domain-containing protein [Tepidibacter thalassicus]|uniref:IPT/TIG domain-containing protein n=1 Tax=Tepidibacter thalassicus DSM 15285 TaxID=1123350 RepID=A0A1M5RB70_9FIRM|nr:IPT/TIG domain-containing protein [Tepidibacter thalassicus]SHH23286.1 IPT/TIG domain-containing protein [Tepidibacter thalassicus DSM 15285]
MKSKLIKGSIKKLTSLVLIFFMVFGMMPWGEIKSYAVSPVVNRIEIMKIYKEGYNTASLYYLTIYGTDLNTLEVKLQDDTGQLSKLTPSESGNTSVQYEIPLEKEGSVFEINGSIYNLSEGDMPRIKGVTKTLVKAGEKIGILAEKLNNIDTNPDDDNKTIKVEYFRGTNRQDISNELKHTDDSLQTKEITAPTGIVGSQHMEVVKSYKEGTVDVKIQYRYLDAFRIYDDINIDSEIKIFPNKAKVGDKVTIKTETLPESSYSVFLLKQEIDPLLGKNLAIDIQTYQHPTNDDTITFKVPNLPTGTYEVILTNPINTSGVDPETNLTNQIIKQKDIGKFTIVDGKFLPEVQSVSPSAGPDSGSEVKIYGKYFEELNIDGLINADDSNITSDNLEIIYDNEDKIKKLKITYPVTSATKYDGKQVDSVERRISVIIGYVADFEDKTKQDFKHGANEFDSLSVIAKPLETSDKDTIKDVQVNIETRIMAEGKEYKIYESALKKDAYEYIKSFVVPTIDTVTPDTILVKEEGGVFKTSNDVVLSIKGKDFNVYKYTDDTGKEIINYPKIVIGVNDENVDGNNEIVMKKVGNDVYIYDKDTNDYKIYTNAMLDVLDSQGKEIDGSFGRETGNKIIVKIPSGLKISSQKVNVSSQAIGVGNPIRKSQNHVPLTLKSDAIKFVATEDVPVIENVRPNVVTVNGGEEVEIIGSNYKDGVKVFIDGEEVTGIKRQGDGKKITFTAPKGRAGDTLIYVINPSNGGIATYPFKYVETYTQPEIIDFSPKKGKTGTLVVVKGENLIPPDPTALEKDIFKLVGTRVLLEGKDINEYNRDPNTKEIKLQDYTSADNDKLFKVEDNNLIIAEYYHSIILKDEDTNKFYTIDLDVKGNPILSNGLDKKYTIKHEGNNIKAYKDTGGVYNVTVNNNSIVINEGTPITLQFKTPFKIEGNKIVGDNVKVVNSETLYFKVPILEADGYYDVTIENPDTKKDSKVDESGFYYYTQPSTKPVIESIYPNQGSVDGGYTITIKGKKTEGKECFVDNGNEKTKVFINGIEVEKDNVKVSTDGLSIEVVVPKLDIDLRDKYNTDRLTVPVVVVNPDGGSYSVEDGFIYVVPSSHPEITKLMPSKGKASGDEIVEILGKDFRFFEPYNDANRNQTWDIGEEYKDLNKYKIKFDGIDEAEDGSNTKGPDDFSNKTFDNLKQLYKNPDGTLNEEKFKERIIPVLPKVYFGGKQAEIIEFANGYLKVKTPSVDKAETVDVYIVNNDAGRSNKVKYTYESSNPNIEKITPSQGKKQGKDNIEIIGSDFAKSEIKLAQKQADGKLKASDSFQKQVLVKFGEITNGNIERDQPNSGLITNSRTTVNLEGGLSVSYDGLNDKVVITVAEGDKTYTNELIEYKDEVVYVPLDLLVNSENNSQYDGYELIKLEVKDRRLIVERGYSPQADLLNSGQIEVKTPSYYTIGKVPVTVINPDGGEAKGEFEYTNPTVNPKITDIIKDNNPSESSIEKVDEEDAKVIRVNYKGGNTITIKGEDFAEDGIIYIGNEEIPFSELEKKSSTELIFKMPEREWEVDKPYAVIVSTGGTSANSKDVKPNPIYIVFTKGETPNLAIESITPDRGPSTGGTKVEIIGKDFRQTMKEYKGKIKIYFGEGDNLVLVPDSNIISVSPNKIVLTTPPHAPGVVSIKVENPDGNIAELQDGFTYVSNPRITGVVSTSDDKTMISEISINGGEEVKIKGSDFAQGARVVFAPVIEEVKGDEISGDVIIINEKKYILKSGNDASDINVVNSQNIIVKTPEGKLGTKGVIVINPDGAATAVYNGIIYVTSKISPPANVNAELINDDRYIKISWDEVKDATSYEVYVIEDDKAPYLIGTTNLTTFVYRDLEPRTDYRFIVKALGEYGLSKGSKESNEVTTKRHVGYEDKDGEISENTSMEKSGDTANVVIGTDDYDEKETVIDLTKGVLAGSKEVVVSIPAKVVSSYSAKDVTIIGSDFYIKFNPTAFNVSKMYDNRKESNAGVKFKVSLNGKKNSSSLSNEYILSASAFVGQESTEIDYLKSKVEISLDFDVDKANMRRLKNISLRRYDVYRDEWVYIKQRMDDYSSAINAKVDRLGIYSIIGKRR